MIEHVIASEATALEAWFDSLSRRADLDGVPAAAGPCDVPPPDDEDDDPEAFLASATDRQLIDSLTVTATGIELGRRLAAIDPAGLGEADLLQVAVAQQRLAGWLAAETDRTLAALAGLPAELPPYINAALALESSSEAAAWRDIVQDGRGDALAAATGISPAAASGRIHRAAQLAPGGPLQDTGRLLRDGRLTESCAKLIAERLAPLPDAVAGAIEAKLLPDAPGLSWARLDRRLRRLIAAARPAHDEQAAADARAARHLGRPAPRPDGTAAMTVEGPAEDIWTIWTAADAAARAKSAELAAATADAGGGAGAGQGAGRASIDARRFDALLQWASRALADPQLPTLHGRRPAINVTVALSTLLDLDDQPAELAGHGPLAAEAARRLAADPTGTWRRLLTDPAGRLGPYPIQTYRPPQQLADAVIARDRTCTFPNCDRPGQLSDIDHRTSYPAGPTSWDNLHSLCRRHHLLKTLGVWTCAIDPATGSTRWTHHTGLLAIEPRIPHDWTAPRAWTASRAASPASPAAPAAPPGSVSEPADPSPAVDRQASRERPAADDLPPY
jgi:hypothetical protein